MNTVTSVLEGDIRGFVSKMGQARGEMDATTKQGEAVGGRISKSISTAGTAIGAAMTGIGAGILAVSEPAERSQKLLEVAIRNTGKAYTDYASPIDNAVAKQERYGHGVADTKEALAKLTQATHDPKKALEEMAFVTDLAANKNISLSEAAAIDIKMLAGNAKVYKEYGINVKDSTKLVKAAEDATKAHTAAVELNKKNVQALAELQARLADKYQMSVSQQQQVTAAEHALADARKKGDPAAIHKAEQNLADLRARIADSLKMSVSDQQALAHAQDAVSTSTTKVTDTAKQADAATKASADQVKALGSDHDRVKHQISGTADAMSETWIAKGQAVITHIKNMIAALGPNLGAALTVTGPAVAALAGGLDTKLAGALGRGVKNIAEFVVDLVAGVARTVASSAAGAVATSAHWVASAATSTAAWVAEQARFVVLMAARGVIAGATAVEVGARAVASAAVSGAAWLAEKAAFVAGQAVKLAIWLATNAIFVATAVASGIAAAAAFMLPLLPFILIGAAVVALVVLVVLNWSKIVDFVKGAASAIWEFLKGAFDKVADAVQWLAKVGAKGLEPFFAAFDAIKKVVGEVWDKFTGFVSWIGSALKPAFDGIAKVAKTVGDAINTINPFAKHSPSLVENVEAGTRIIEDHYARLGSKVRGSLSGSLATGPVAFGAGGSSMAGGRVGSSDSGGITVQVTVQGHVLNWTQTAEALAEPIRVALLQKKRNTGTLGLA